MCQRCGCADFIKEGQEAVLKQAAAIIKEMGVTADNVQRFKAVTPGFGALLISPKSS